MIYYAVSDTNVLVSSMLKHDSIPGIVLDKVYTKEIIPIINEKIVDEYNDALSKNK